MKLSRILTFLISVVLSTSMAMAQSAADNLYNQGLKAQSVMTVKSQKQAIAKFTQAKKMYDSAAKKAQCDNAIAVSRNLIKQIPGNGGGGKNKNNHRGSSSNSQTSKEPVKPAITLELSNTSFDIPRDYKVINVTVVTNHDSWDVNPVACSDGSTFLKVEKKDGNDFAITVPANNTTSTRSQQVMVTAGDVHKEVTITQTGIPVYIDTNEKLIKFKKKGGSKKVTISSNFGEQYDENSNENWIVESKPSWILITLNEKREKGWLAKLADKGTELVKGKSSNEDATIIQSSVTITADPLPSGTSNRKGEIVIRSGESAVSIHVTQQ